MNSSKGNILAKMLRLILILRCPCSEQEIRDELGLKGRSNSTGYLQAIANDPDLGPRLKHTMELTGGRPKKMWVLDYFDDYDESYKNIGLSDPECKKKGSTTFESR